MKHESQMSIEEILFTMVWNVLLPAVVAGAGIGTLIVGGILLLMKSNKRETPHFSYLETPKYDRKKACVVCELPINGNSMTKLICGHEYHDDCFANFLTFNNSKSGKIKCANPACHIFVLHNAIQNDVKVFSVREKQCNICEKLLSEDVINLGLECDHLFHTKCFTEYINSKDSSKSVACPAHGCFHLLSDDVLTSFKERKCLLCDDLMSSVDSLVLECEHIFHRKCIESYRILKLVKKLDFVCPVPHCKISIRENIFSSSFCDSEKEILQKSIFALEETKIADEKVDQQERDKIVLESLDTLPAKKDDCNSDMHVRRRYLSDAEWMATKKCLLCRNFLSEGETYKLSCKHTYHLSCLIKRSNKARADSEDNTCPLVFCKRSIPYLYGNVNE